MGGLEPQDQGDGEGRTSLAPYRESSTSSEGYQRCPRKLGWMLVNRAIGQAYPARCKSNGCPYCGPINAHLIAGALSLTKPERAVLFTQAGTDWQATRRKMNRLNEYLKREGHTSFLAYHVEPNPKATGRHVHGWQRGEYLPQAKLSKLSEKAGLGSVVFINRIKQKVGQGQSIGYGLKGLTYGLKMAEADGQIREFLEVNGGRLVHAQRGFWEIDGKPMGLREAMATYARSKGDDERIGTWELVREDQLAVAMAGSSGPRSAAAGPESMP